MYKVFKNILTFRVKNPLVVSLILSGWVISWQAMAEEEVAVPLDAPPTKQEIIQQASDGEVSVPRVRKFVKPNRMLMHASVANTKVGNAFLDENSRKPGVVTLKNGLQYKVIKAGVGAKPKDEDIIKCIYKGMLIDGTVFEQSDQAKPANIKVAPLAPGLKEAIKLMALGAKWEVYIPSELGFASAGKPPKVGPDAVLVYNLELLGINPSAPTQP